MYIKKFDAEKKKLFDKLTGFSTLPFFRQLHLDSDHFVKSTPLRAYIGSLYPPANRSSAVGLLLLQRFRVGCCCVLVMFHLSDDLIYMSTVLIHW